MRYAKSTSVTPERSLEEIKRLLRNYGADGFAQWERRGTAAVAFEIDGLTVRMAVNLPDRSEFEATETGRRKRSEEAIDAAHEQAVRQRWRALVLAIRSKLVAVESGISSLLDEFLAYVVVDGGKTVGERMGPALQKCADEGRTPKLLPLLSD